jgi:DNA-directed RNA polymerase specialized sigma24 family protein
MNQPTFFTLKYPERQKEDAVLLRHLINHEDDALSVFLDMYGPLLLGYSGAFIRPVEDREDVVHDMLMEVWNRPPTLQDGSETFYQWLIFTIRRRIITKCREDISEGNNTPMSPEELISKIRSDEQSAWSDTLLRGARKSPRISHVHRNNNRYYY